jgi:CobQ-like glutamine amidotransferase family enzyme
MITIFSFEPAYFNNNGDQGNLVVLKRVLQDSKIRTINAKSPATAEFLLVGDASIAVMEHFSRQLEKLTKFIAKRYELGEPTLIVGSSYEFFAERLGLEVVRAERRSEFITTPENYFGYRNSDNELPDCLVKGSFIGTNLFGPVLAKNPTLLALVIEALGGEMELSAKVSEWIEAIRQQNG